MENVGDISGVIRYGWGLLREEMEEKRFGSVINNDFCSILVRAIIISILEGVKRIGDLDG